MMTEKMIGELHDQGADLDRIYYCMHHPEGSVPEYRKKCECRKPKPGMLVKAAEELGIDLSQSYFVGDGITDVQAGQAAGVQTILVYPSSRCYICSELNDRNVQPDFIVKNLEEAAEMIRVLESSRKAEQV
jgi:D,D-heptose 1,7-bisphosphate phosphatase